MEQIVDSYALNSVAEPQQSQASYDIGLLFFNRAQQTLWSVLSFLKEEIKPDIIILDQGSIAEQRKFLEDALRDHSNVRFITLRQNIGVAAGRNRLCRECSSDWILFIDSDITLNTEGGVGLMNSGLQGAGDVDGFLPRLFNVHENQFLDRLRLTRDSGRCLSEQIAPEDKVTNIFPGGAVILRRSILLNQPYDEEYFVGFEDYELALRAFTRGRPLRLKTLDEVTLAHMHLPAIDESDIETTQVRYSNRFIEHGFEVLKKAYGDGLFENSLEWVEEQPKEMVYCRRIEARVPQGNVDLVMIVDGRKPPIDHMMDMLQQYIGSGYTLTPVYAHESADAGQVLRRILDLRPHFIHFMNRTGFLELTGARTVRDCAALMNLNGSAILDRFCESHITFSVGDSFFLNEEDIKCFRPFYWLSDGYCITSPDLVAICQRNSDCPKPTAMILGDNEDPGFCRPNENLDQSLRNENFALHWRCFFAEIAQNAHPAASSWKRQMIGKFYLEDRHK